MIGGCGRIWFSGARGVEISDGAEAGDGEGLAELIDRLIRQGDGGATCKGERCSVATRGTCDQGKDAQDGKVAWHGGESVVAFAAAALDLSASFLSGQAAFFAAATWLGGAADFGGLEIGDDDCAEAFPTGVFILALRAMLITIQEQVAGFGDEVGDGGTNTSFDTRVEGGGDEGHAKDAAGGALVDVLSTGSAAGGE